MKKVSPYIKKIIDSNSNYYTTIETDEKITSALKDLSLIYAPIDIKNELLSSMSTSINNLSGVYVPISSFNSFQNDILTGYLTEEKIDEKYQTISGLNNILSSYMNSDEVSSAIRTSNHLQKEIVNVLPEIQNALQNTIYMVLNSASIDQNIYDEYMLINNNWERIGNTAINILNYANLNNKNIFLNNQTISGNLTVNDTITAQSGYFININLGDKSLNGYLTYIDTLYGIHEVGYEIIQQNSSSFTPINERIYKHTLSNNDEITFITTQLSNTKVTTFELHLIQPSTPVSFTFTNPIKWIYNLNFNSLNPVPDFSIGNKEYAIIIRWDGTEFLGNIIYTKDIEIETES